MGHMADFFRTVPMTSLRPLAFAAACAFAAAAAADTKPVENAAGDASTLPEIISRQWTSDPVDLRSLRGNVVLLLFWQKPTGS
jgi:hypothetical protein